MDVAAYSAELDGEQSANLSQAATGVKRHPKFCFDNTLIAIQIENTLFNVHKYQLMRSTTFSDMFAIGDEPQDAEKSQEGLSLENPIIMHGVSASDFESLLTVLYTGRFTQSAVPLKSSVVASAFRLANMWDFACLRSSLLPHATAVLDDVDKIIFAREFGLKDWVVPAYVGLCERKEPLTTLEARKLGVDALLFVSRMREARPIAPDCSKALCPGGRKRVKCAHCHSQLCTIEQNRVSIEERVKEWVGKGCIVRD